MIRHSRSKTIWTPGIHFLVTVGILILAVPQLPRFLLSQSGLFSALWISLAMVVLGSNLWFLLGVHKERGSLVSVRTHRGGARAITPTVVETVPKREYMR